MSDVAGWVEWLHLENVNLISTTLRLVLALSCGGLLGMERGRKRRPAGFRTHMLVCVGAALVMITNEYMCGRYANVDPARMGAQVVSGIGFLGAGTIMVTGMQQVKGLTTAAGLWAVACIGLALGTGYYSGGIIATVLFLVINTILYRFENRMNTNNPVIDVFIEFEDIIFLEQFFQFAREHDMKMTAMDVNHSRVLGENRVGVIMTLKCRQRMNHDSMIYVINTAKGVKYVEEI